MKLNYLYFFFILFVSLVLSTGTNFQRRRYSKAKVLEAKKDIEEATKKASDLFQKLQDLTKTPHFGQEALDVAKQSDSFHQELEGILKNILSKIPADQAEMKKHLQNGLDVLGTERKRSQTQILKADAGFKNLFTEQENSKSASEEINKKAAKIEKDFTKERKKHNTTEAEVNTPHKRFKSRQTKSDNAAQVSGIIGACTSSLVSYLQGPFCYKQGADAGQIPNCPDNYDDIAGLCQERCRSGYRRVAITCVADCPGGWTDIGVSCSQIRYKKIWFVNVPYPVFQTKDVYAPHTYTLVDSHVSCSTGMYKAGLLCYRDCNKIGYVNCGIGACASDTAACVAAIVNMVVSIAAVVLNAILLVLSLGTSSAGVDQAIDKAMIEGAKLSTNAITSANKAVRSFLNYLKSQGEKFLNMMTQKALKDYLKGLVSSAPDQIMVRSICSDVFDLALQRSQSPQAQMERQIRKYDLLGIYDTVNDCKTLQTDNSNNQKTSCARSALATAGFFDPTGILNVASAFTYATCTDV